MKNMFYLLLSTLFLLSPINSASRLRSDCCSSRTLTPSNSDCTISSAVYTGEGESGTIHLFTKGKQYVRVDGIRSNGFPIINQRSFPRPADRAFPGLDFQPEVSFQSSKSKIILAGNQQVAEYVVDDKSKKIIRRNSFGCSSPGNKNIFCDPNTEGTIDELVHFSPDVYWAQVVKLDGSVSNILIKSNKVSKRYPPTDKKSNAIVIYAETDKEKFGLDFLRDGRVVPFAVDTSKGSADIRQFEKEQRLPGLESRVFLGCPQSFCWNAAIDAAMNFNGQVVIFRGPYYWAIPITDEVELPISFPDPLDAKEISFAGIQYVDAAAELSSPQQGFLLFVEKTVFFVKSLSSEKPWKSMPLEEFVYGSTKEKRKAVSAVDAAWFNHVSQSLLLFIDKEYYEMKLIPSNSKDKMQFSFWLTHPNFPILDDFKINTPDIDAAFSIGRQGILIKHNWFYVIPEEDWVQPSAPYGAELSFGSKAFGTGLFDIQQACQYSTQEFRDLQNRMDQEFGLSDASEEGRFIRNIRRELEFRGGDSRDPRDYKNKLPPRKGFSDDSVGTSLLWPIIVVTLLVLGIFVVVGAVMSQNKRQIGSNSLTPNNND